VAADDVHPDDMPDDRLDAFFDELRTAAAEAPTPVVGDALATLFRDGQAPVMSTAPVARRRRWSARAAIAGAVAGVTFGGLGVAGALPAPVQRGVADVVRQVGVHLPDPGPATTTTSTTVAPTTASTTSTTVERGTSDEHRQDELEVEDRGSSDEHRQDGDSSGRGSSDENRQDGDVEDGGGSDDRSQHDEEDDNRGSGRNPSTAEDVHPDDDPQAADRRDNDHGGSSE
jgi:hypothetical protein